MAASRVLGYIEWFPGLTREEKDTLNGLAKDGKVSLETLNIFFNMYKDCWRELYKCKEENALLKAKVTDMSWTINPEAMGR